MRRHQSIQLLFGRAMDLSTTFPCKNLLSQLLPKLANGFQGSPCGGRFSPLSLKLRHLTRAHQPSRLKPAQERAEIREQLHRLAVLNRTRIQEIQGQMVADEEEPVSPVRIRGYSSLSHISARGNDNTYNVSFYRLAHLMV